MKMKKTRFSCAPPGIMWFRRLMIFIAMVLFMQNDITAQDLIVNGTVNNTGTIRVKNQTILSQPAVSGEIVLTGANQSLPAKIYEDVQLLGTGIKTTTGGNLSINGNLTIAAAVTLQIQQGNVITLGDTLFESGVLKGAIQKSVDLTGSTTSSNFGNIGATISWSSNAPGITNVVRASDSMQIANGNQSVKRFYKITSADTTAAGNIAFRYSTAELNGHDTLSIELWQSIDNGASWRRRPAIVDVLNKTISKNNVPLTGLWAIADTSKPLGPLTSAGIPAYFTTLLAPPPQSILTQVQPFTVVITDAFGDPVPNVAVTFAITSKPVNTTGDTLSVYATLSDSLGRASTRLTLGSKVGDYVVTATSPTLSPVQMTIKAFAGAPAALAVVSGNNQSDTLLTTLQSPLIVSVRDIGDNPVESTLVRFAMNSTPTNATGQSLSVDSVLTDSTGNAGVILHLGNKPGTYSVSATSQLLPPTVLTVTAVKNTPAVLTQVSGNNQSDTILTSMQSPFIVSIKDIRGNPVDSAMIQFSIATTPLNAAGQGLSSTTVYTDTNGLAGTTLTIGSKVGQYTVNAVSSVGTIPPITFTVNAVRGQAATIQIVAGINQTGIVGTELSQPFTVSLADIGGNPANGDTVLFSVVSAPDSATQVQLSAGITTTDITGLAASKLTLGTRTGTYVVGASSPKLPGTLFFASTAIPGTPKILAATSGNNQTSQILTTVANDIIVKVLDSLGNGVANRTVNFAITSAPANASGQNVTQQSAITDVNGTAITRIVFGNKTGEYVLTASAAGLPDLSIVAHATPGAASVLIASQGQQQIKQINTQLDTAFVVNVMDIGSNDVPGTIVAFSIVSTPLGAVGAALSDTLVTSDSTGRAQTFLTLGSKVGTYEILASVITVPEVQEFSKDREAVKNKHSVSSSLIETRFFARASHGAPASLVTLSGNGQLRPTESTLDTSFGMYVYDAGLNAVPNVPVTFSIIGTPFDAQGQRLSDSLVTSDSLGFASSTLTLGDRQGVYTVGASVNGVQPVTFNASAYILFGDLNKDIDVNIADITAYIDFIIGKKILTRSDSIKADINGDNQIDLNDISLLRETILNKPLPSYFITAENLSGQPRTKESLDKFRRTSVPNAYQNATARLEATPLGLRLNLENIVSVRGIEMRLLLKDTVLSSVGVNLQFTRAKELSIFTRTDSNEVRLVAFNEQNNGIDIGQGSLFRLSNITNTNLIDTAQIILSVESNVAVQPGFTVLTAPQGQYPTRFALRQNYPNPFNGSTNIMYEIPDGYRLIKSLLQVYNVLGQKVKTIVSREHDPGTYTVTWDGTDENGVAVSSGVYFYRLMSKDYSTARKMIYVK